MVWVQRFEQHPLGALIFIIVPGLVYAGELALISEIWIATWVFLCVQVVCLVGYGAARLSDWARWRDDSGTAVEQTERKLQLFQGMLVSLFAGNVAYYAGATLAEGNGVPLMVGAGAAAYSGDKVLQRMMGK